jgi:hypothetical protein
LLLPHPLYPPAPFCKLSLFFSVFTCVSQVEHGQGGRGGGSVVNPWHFGVDPDPDPWIHASDKWIRIRILDPDPAIFLTNLQDANKKLI